METIILYGLITSSLYYLGSRALVTRWLWSRYPTRLALFFDCSSCSGAWYGLIVGLTVGRMYNLTYLGLPSHDWPTPIVVALASLAATPIFAGLMQWGFDKLGTTAPFDPDETGEL